MLKVEREVWSYLKGVLPPEHYRETTIVSGGKHFHLALEPLRLHMPIPKSPSCDRWFKNWRTEFMRRYRARCLEAACPILA